VKRKKLKRIRGKGKVEELKEDEGKMEK